MNSDRHITRVRNEFLRAYKNEDFLRAMIVGEKLLELYKSKGMENSYNFAEDLYKVGYVYAEDGKEDRAIDLYTKSADLILNIQGQTVKLADIFNNLAVIFAKQNNYDQAIAYFKKCAKIRMDILASDHKDNIDILYNLASAYFDKGNIKKALSLYKESLGKRSKRDLDFSDNLNSIGYCYEKMDDLENAIDHFNQALDTIAEIDGEDSKDYTSNIYHLAKAYERANILDEAEECYNDAIQLIKNHFGDKHPYYAEALNKLSNIYVINNKYKKAMQLRLKAVNLLKKTVGTDHIYYANCLRGLGEIYVFEKDYLKAGLMYAEAMDIKKKVVGIDTEDYVIDAITLSQIYFLQEKPQKAIDLLNFIINNISAKNKLYKKCLLNLVKAYSFDGEGQRLYDIYEKYVLVEPEKSFDDMLEESKNL